MSRVFQVCFQCVWRMFHMYFQVCFKDVVRKLRGCFISVSMVFEWRDFQRFFQEVSRKLWGCLRETWWIFLEWCMDVSRKIFSHTRLYLGFSIPAWREIYFFTGGVKYTLPNHNISLRQAVMGFSAKLKI